MNKMEIEDRFMTTETPVQGIVVVHGIGKHQPLASVQRVITQFARVNGHDIVVPLGDIASQLYPHGISNSEFGPDSVGWARFDYLPGYAFSEIHWADIAETHAASVVPPLTEWARSIPMQISYIDLTKYNGKGLSKTQLLYTTGIVDDTILSLQLMRLILGSYRIETDELIEFIRYFIGSLLVFSEFSDLREKIMHRFNTAMESLSLKAASVNVDQIHLSSHSLGSVIALLGIVKADKIGSEKPPWLLKLGSFCTMGSPIDLFLPIWKSVWEEYSGTLEQRPVVADEHRPRIHWINFVDNGDPIASTLNIARDLVNDKAPGLFLSSAPQEITFNTNSWPGGAHLAYWKNTHLFDVWTGRIKALSKVDPFIDDKSTMSDGISHLKSSELSLSWHPWVFLLPVLFSITTGWQIIFWYEAGFGRTPLSRVGTFSLGMFVGLQIFLEVVVGSTLVASRRPFRIVEVFLAFFTIIATVLFPLLYSGGEYNNYFNNHINYWYSFLIGVAILQLGFGFVNQKRSRKFVIVLLSVCCLIGSLIPWHTDKLQDIANDVLRLAFIFATWWLASLCWRFYVVWSDYVSGRRHIDWLRKRWSCDLKVNKR
jgi:hypothetical protein